MYWVFVVIIMLAVFISGFVLGIAFGEEHKQ